MTDTAPSPHAGMGAVSTSSGVTFRVWAPHADHVGVTGDFDDWSRTAHALEHEGGGYWSGDVSTAQTGHRYKFVIRRGATEQLRVDPYAREVVHSSGDGVVHDPSFDWSGDEFVMPPWNELVIYEMHIGTFHDEPGGRPGCFRRAIERLPHLRELGINAVEIMPAAEFPGGYSWGYNTAHPFAVETDYGGPRALKEFVRAAHDLGIAVLVDVVFNHFGPGDLDLWRFDGWSEGDGGGIYFYNDWRAGTPWGHTRPDYGRSEVRQYLRDNALMWLEEFRIDGLRWDATAYIRNVHGFSDPGADLSDGWNLMRWVNDEIDARQGWKISIAEDLRGEEALTRTTHDGGAGFDAQWNGVFVHAVRDALVAIDDSDRDLHAVKHAIESRYSRDAFERVIYTESHDEVANGRARLPEEIWPGEPASYFSKKRSTLGAALVFTAPGIPMLFQGQAMLEDEWFRDDDPLDWSKRERFGGIFQLYSDLVQLRRNWFDSTRGLRGQGVNVHHVNDHDKVIAFERWDQGGPRDSVLVVANFSSRAFWSYRVGAPRGGQWRVRFNSDWQGYDHAFGDHPATDAWADDARDADGMPASLELSIGPYTALILSQDD